MCSRGFSSGLPRGRYRAQAASAQQEQEAANASPGNTLIRREWCCCAACTGRVERCPLQLPACNSGKRAEWSGSKSGRKSRLPLPPLPRPASLQAKGTLYRTSGHPRRQDSGQQPLKSCRSHMAATYPLLWLDAAAPNRVSNGHQAAPAPAQSGSASGMWCMKLPAEQFTSTYIVVVLALRHCHEGLCHPGPASLTSFQMPCILFLVDLSRWCFHYVALCHFFCMRMPVAHPQCINAHAQVRYALGAWQPAAQTEHNQSHRGFLPPLHWWRIGPCWDIDASCASVDTGASRK